MAIKSKVNYQNGKIYSIRSHQTDKVYYGSTTQLLCKRIACHRKHYRAYKKGTLKMCLTSFKIVKYDDAYIELVENFPCNTKQELEKREGQVIRENNDAVNKLIPGRTENEYREERNIKMKQYYETNKAFILERMKNEYLCDCGSKCRHSDKNRHEKTIKHQKYVNRLTQLGELNKMHNEIMDRHKNIYPLKF